MTKYIPKRIAVSLILLVAIILGATYYFQYGRGYYFVNFKTPECQVDNTSSGCKLKVVHLQTVTGDDVVYYYDNSKVVVQNKTGRLSDLRYGEKVQVTKAQNPEFISKIRAVN